MKVLHLCPDLGVPVLGNKGASIHVRELAKAMRDQGHTVVLVAGCLTKSPWEPRVAFDGPLVHIPPGPAIADAVAGVKALRDGAGAASGLPDELRRILYDRELLVGLRERFGHHPPELIYERASLYSTTGATLARELGVPRIVELNAPLAVEHATYRDGGTGNLAAAAESTVLTSADAVVVVSEHLRDYAVELGVMRDRVTVRPNGVDLQRFCPGPRDGAARHLAADGEATLGFVGGLRQWHGVEILPPLLARLSHHRPPVRLIIAGDGPMAGPLRRDLVERGLDGRVTFTGAVVHDDVPALIRQFDVALAPYPVIDHAFYFSPLKIFEYLACGVPVVAPAVGQIPSIVGHERAGLLYEPGDLNALATASGRLLADAALRESLGATGAALAREHHGWDVVAADTMAQAEELVGARR
jgi:glycosyltransferase involved in cell wall biosynthesis